MGDHDDELVLANFLDQFHNLDGCLTIESAGGFIGEKNIRLIDQSSCDGDSLALSAGELVWHLLIETFQPDLVEGFSGSFGSFFFSDTGDGQGQFDILLDILMGNEVIGLEDEADSVVSIDIPVMVDEVLGGSSFDDEIAGCIVVKSTEDVQQSSLSASGRTENRNEFILSEIEADSLECVDRTVFHQIVFFDAFESEHR